MNISSYSTHLNAILDIFMICGVIAGSVSGAVRAVDSRMDITGALLLAFLTSNAGGTIRDLILKTSVFWIVNNSYIWISLISGAMAFVICFINIKFLTSKIIHKILLISDAIGLGVFCFVAIEKSFLLGYNVVIAVIMGIWTAVGGGIVADMVANRIPLVFYSELYIVVALFGAMLYLGLRLVFPQSIAALLGVLFVVVFRMISVKYSLKLPIIKT